MKEMDNLQEQRYKLAFFDMDGTILNGRTIYTLADTYDFLPQVKEIINLDIQPYEQSIRIAELLKGLDIREILQVFQTIPLQPHVDIVMKRLKTTHVVIILLTDSYQFLADDLCKRLNIDYAFANHLVIKDNIITGKLIISNARLQSSSDGRIYSICKSAFMDALSLFFDVGPQEILAVGDSHVDRDMIKKAGLGVAYKAPQDVSEVAHLTTDDFSSLLAYLKEW